MDETVYSFEAERAVFEARAMFQRVLTGWAMDVLALRREGLDTPTVRAPQDNFPIFQAMRDAA